jgi:hypothetical protein
MGACLRFWAAWLNGAAQNIERNSTAADAGLRGGFGTWTRRCRRLARRVGALAETPPFVEAGDAPAHLTLSAVFRNDLPYRRFYRLWQDMNLGIAAIFGDHLNLPLARTFELYELWCFLRLVRAGAEEFGAAGLETKNLFVTTASGGVTLATSAVTVSVGQGLKLFFQKQYREFWIEADNRGSYSRTMAPDVVAAIMSPASDEADRIVVLDAKYRIEDGLNDALSSIHTYKDALVREAEFGSIEGIVSAAYLMSPTLPGLNADYRDTPLPGRLFHPEYRARFRFGAVMLRPGMSIAEVGATLRVIIADSVSGSA